MNTPFIPDYMLGTMSWLSRGYSLAGTPPVNLLDPSSLNSGDKWIAFAAVLESVKRGQFGALGKLHRFVLPDLDKDVGIPSIRLMGDAGTARELQVLKQLLETGFDNVLVEAARACSFAGQLWLVPSMIRGWQRATDRDGHVLVGLAISQMLEPHGGPLGDLGRNYEIAEGSSDKSAGEEFAGSVLATVDVLKEKNGTASMWRGNPFDVRALAHAMQAQLALPYPDSLSPAFIEMSHKMEATTGRSFSGSYKGGVLYPLFAQAVMDQIDEDGQLDQFIPGKRYFFGHLIPN